MLCSSQQFLCGMFISIVPLPCNTVSLNQGYKMILLREPSQVWSEKAIYFHWPSWSSEFRFSSLAHLRIKHCHRACNYSMKVISKNEHWKGVKLSLEILVSRKAEKVNQKCVLYVMEIKIVSIYMRIIMHLFKILFFALSSLDDTGGKFLGRQVLNIWAVSQDYWSR